ncbi:Lhr family ATP-dependent helicase, partial [Tomitella cavernea]
GEADDAARARLSAAGLDDRAAANLLGLLAEQRGAVGAVPDDVTLVVERFVDELGDWRVVLHSPYGRRVHAPWALAVGARLSDEHGVDAHPAAFDDGIVLRLPATTGAPPGAGIFAVSPQDIDRIVADSLGGSALFAARFRECAARALLLPRRDPGRRAPLWQQRHRSAQLLGVARRHPEFPILHETVRECMQDVYDLPALRGVLRRIDDGTIRLHEAETAAPSPFASSLLFDYVAAFIYDDDVPLAERKAAALSLDPGLLAQLLGEVELSALLDPDVVRDTDDALQWRSPNRRIRDAESLADLLRIVGPLTDAGIAERAEGDPAPWLGQLADARRIFRFEQGGTRWAAVEDAPRLRDGLAAPVPSWLPEALAHPVADPLGDLVGRYARTHGPFTAAEAAAALPVGVAVAAQTLERLAHAGRIVRGRFRPPSEPAATAGDAAGDAAPQWCDADVLRTLRRRSLEHARARLAPVPKSALGRFLPPWQHVGGPAALRGVDGLFEVIDQLAGAVLPASALETLVLPARVADYRPEMLDELTSAGEIFWTGCGRAGARDGWIALHTAESAATSMRPPTRADSDGGGDGGLRMALLSTLDGGGAYFFRALADAARAAPTSELANTGFAAPHAAATDADVLAALWDLVWEGRVTGDTLAPLRALQSGAARRPASPRARGGRGGRPRLPARSGPPAATGRWSLVPAPAADATVRLHDTARRLLDRYGVVTPGVAAAEGVDGGFARLYRVLGRFEEAGQCRRGYVIDSLGGAQFAAPESIDLLRAAADADTDDSDGTGGRPLVLAAADPANPYGAAVDWPRPHADGHRPSRAAGAVVVLVGGAPRVFVERGGRSILTFSEDREQIVAALTALAAAPLLHAGMRRPLVVARWNGESVHGNAHAAPLADAGFRLTPRGYRATW